MARYEGRYVEKHIDELNERYEALLKVAKGYRISAIELNIMNREGQDIREIDYEQLRLSIKDMSNGLSALQARLNPNKYSARPISRPKEI